MSENREKHTGGIKMKVGELADAIEEIYPHYLAEKWDNSGLLCGSRESRIKKVMTALDASMDVIGEAVLCGANMIVTHHPIMFSGVKKITMDDIDGKIIYSLIKNNISLFSAHTNLDNSEHGLNKYAADLMELENQRILVPHESVIGAGIGIIGDISRKKDMDVKDIAEEVKRVFKIEYVRFTGSENKKVRKAAIVTGSGGDFVKAAARASADVLITGDIKYHTALEADLMGITVIDAGHYATEIMAADIFADIIKNAAPGIEVIKSSQKDVFKFI